MSQQTNVQQRTSATVAQGDDDFVSHFGSWREALVIARDQARVAPVDGGDKSYWDGKIRAFDEAFAAYSPSAIPDDFRTHHSAWREGLVIARDRAIVQLPDVDDRAYWEHELTAYDRAFAAIGIELVHEFPAWTSEDCAVAEKQGWNVFDVDGSGYLEIQKDDEAQVFESDDDARAYVRTRVKEGCPVALKAMNITERVAQSAEIVGRQLPDVSPEALKAAEPELTRFAFLIRVSNTIGDKEELPSAARAIDAARGDRTLGLLIWAKQLIMWNDVKCDPALSDLLPMAMHAIDVATDNVATVPTVTLADGYNGHTVRFDANPIEIDGELVKLRCAESGKEYMTAWRSADVLRGAIDSQGEARTASRGWIREVAGNILKQYAGLERVANLYDSDEKFSGALRDLAGTDFEYPDFSHLSVADAVKKAARLGGPLPKLDTQPHRSRAALAPDFEAVRDKRMSELTPAQQEDSLEAWLRAQVGTMPEYHEKHYRFLLKRLDEIRQVALAADVPALDVRDASANLSGNRPVKPIFEPHMEQFRGGLLRVHTTESDADFLIPKGVTDRKSHLMEAARLARIESENLRRRANEMAERARCAEVAASLCEQPVAQPDQSASPSM